MSFFNANKRVEDSPTLEMAITRYILELPDLVTKRMLIMYHKKSIEHGLKS